VERLRQWLKALNHDDCNLRVDRCGQGSSGSGYGAFAGAGGVAKGSVILKVPREALMTEEVLQLITYLLTQLLLNLSSLRFLFFGLQLCIADSKAVSRCRTAGEEGQLNPVANHVHASAVRAGVWRGEFLVPLHCGSSYGA
jgi:hypothetical protein